MKDSFFDDENNLYIHGDRETDSSSKNDIVIEIWDKKEEETLKMLLKELGL